jgi:spermidine synthase
MLDRLRFYWVVFAGGAVLMALEILSSRLLAPRFGNSVYVWGSIISVFLAALSLGYWWGGKLADRQPSLAGLGRLLTLAAATQAALVLFGSQIADLFGEWTGAAPWGTLVTATLLFAPPSLLLATISPYAIRLAADDLTHLGDTAGRLYALSTLGSLVGTLGATFVLIPLLTLPTALKLILGTTAFTALAALFGELRCERTTATVALLLVVVSFFEPPAFRPTDYGLVHERMTAYQTLRVVDREGVRRLESDRVLHGAIRLDDGELAMAYPHLFPLAWAIDPEIDRALVLGMGGGNSAAYLRRGFGRRLQVDLVDVDPAVPEVAERFMRFRPGDGIRVHVSDGRRFVETSEQTWDLVIVDTYIGLSVPFHMSTVEFVDAVDRRLTPGGVLVVNLAASLEHPFPHAVVRTLASRFETLYAFRPPGKGNSVVFATHRPALDDAELAARAAELDRRHDFDPPLAGLAASRLDLPPLDGSVDVPILTDAYAPVDRLIHMHDREIAQR